MPSDIALTASSGLFSTCPNPTRKTACAREREGMARVQPPARLACGSGLARGSLRRIKHSSTALMP